MTEMNHPAINRSIPRFHHIQLQSDEKANSQLVSDKVEQFLGKPILCENTEEWLKTFMLSLGKEYTIIFEPYHVDRVYRDLYYMYYAAQYKSHLRYCVRLSFFRGRLTEDQFYSDYSKDEKAKISLESKFIGSTTIYPTRRDRVGRTLINPEAIDINYDGSEYAYIRTADYKVTVNGLGLKVNAFPFRMQDSETSSCSEIAIINLMDYYSNRYNDYYFMTPSLLHETLKEINYERTIPTRGLTYSMLSKVFVEHGFYTILRKQKALERFNPEQGKMLLQRYLYTYAESGIPSAINIKYKDNDAETHTVVVLGHVAGKIEECTPIMYEQDKTIEIQLKNTADMCSEFVVMNDQKKPYQVIDLFGSNDIEVVEVMIPLSKRMYMESKDAYSIAVDAIANKQASVFDFTEGRLNSEEPIVTRMFLAPGRKYKSDRLTVLGKKSNISLKKVYSTLPLPKFVWICELYTEKGYKDNKAFGEVVIDATASPKALLDAIIFIRYYDHIGLSGPDKSFDSIIADLKFSKVKSHHMTSKELPNYQNHNLKQIKLK